MVRAVGLALQDHGNGRTLKGHHGLKLTPTFQGPVPAMVFQGQAHGAYHHHRGGAPILDGVIQREMGHETVQRECYPSGHG